MCNLRICYKIIEIELNTNCFNTFWIDINSGIRLNKTVIDVIVKAIKNFVKKAGPWTDPTDPKRPAK